MKLRGLDLLILALVFIEVAPASIREFSGQEELEILDESPLSENPEVVTRFGGGCKKCGHNCQHSCQCCQPYPFVLPYGTAWPSPYGTAWRSQYDDSSSAEKVNINFIRNTNVDNGGLQIANQNFDRPTIADLFNPERVDNPMIQTFDKIGRKLAQDITQQLLNQPSLLYSAPDEDVSSAVQEDEGLDEYDARPSLKESLADLFHPQNLENPIVRAFDKTKTKLIDNVKKALGIPSDDQDRKEANTPEIIDTPNDQNGLQNQDNINKDNIADQNDQKANEDANIVKSRLAPTDQEDQDKIENVNNQDNNQKDQAKRDVNSANDKNAQIDIDNPNSANAQDNPENLAYSNKISLSELFHPDNENNPILQSFENIKSKFVDTILNKLSAIKPVSKKESLLNIAQLLHPENPENPFLRTFENLGKNIAQAYSKATDVDQNDIIKNEPNTSENNDSKKETEPKGTKGQENQLEELNPYEVEKIPLPPSDAKLESEANQVPPSGKANDDSIATFSYNPIPQSFPNLAQSYPFLTKRVIPSQNLVVPGPRFWPSQKNVDVVCLPVRQRQRVLGQNPFGGTNFVNLGYNNYDNSQVRIVSPWTNL